MSVLSRLKPSQWPIHRHDCGWPKHKHRWTHITIGWCGRSKPGKSVALCNQHMALHKRAWDYPTPSQKAAQIASEEREKAEQERRGRLAEYLSSEGPGNEPNQLIKYLAREAEKSQEE